MNRKLKVGDRVTLKKEPANGEFEEISFGVVYEVSDHCFSVNGLPYVQLTGVYSSYGEEQLTLINNKEETK